MKNTGFYRHDESMTPVFVDLFTKRRIDQNGNRIIKNSQYYRDIRH